MNVPMVPGNRAGILDGEFSEIPDDPLERDFHLLKQAAGDQLRAMAKLETVLEGLKGEVARKGGPETFSATFAELGAALADLRQRQSQTEAALKMVPSAAAIQQAAQAGTAPLANAVGQALAEVRAIKAAVESAAATAAGSASAAKEAVLNTNFEWQILVFLMGAPLLVGGFLGWLAHGWWAPTISNTLDADRIAQMIVKSLPPTQGPAPAPMPTRSQTAPEAAPGRNANVRHVGQEMNVRSGPGRNFDSLGTVSPEVALLPTGKADGDWIEVSFSWSDGTTGVGWVNGKLLR